MSNKEQEIQILNNLLQGAYIGIDSYAKCLNRIKDEKLRHKLEHQELEQREIAMELASRIRDLGGTPKDSAGAKGVMSSVMGSLMLADNYDTGEILNILSNGVKMGIDSQEKALMDLDGPGKEMVERHLKEDKRIFNEIENLKRETILH